MRQPSRMDVRGTCGPIALAVASDAITSLSPASNEAMRSSIWADTRASMSAVSTANVVHEEHRMSV
jgi:hypothetical protein